MVLSDLSQEYLYVYECLESCHDYFTICDSIINDYVISISEGVSQYFKETAITDAIKAQLINKISYTYTFVFSEVTKLITASFPFYGALAKLESYSFHNPLLAKEFEEFLTLGKAVMNATNNIITAQLPGMKQKMLLPELITHLQKLIKMYHTLISLHSHIENIDKIVMLKIPDEVAEDSNYNSLEIVSYKGNITLEEYSSSLAQLSSFFTQIELIKKTENSNPKIYMRKLESGSLRLVFGSNTFELKSISDIIRALTDGIRTFRLTSVEKQKLKEENRSLKLENDAKEICIINSQIKSICDIMGLSNDNPEDVEKIQKLCLPLVRYINNNPVGRINDYNYDLTTDMKLLENYYYNE